MMEKLVVDGLTTEMAIIIVLIAQTVINEKIYIEINIINYINLKFV